MSVDDLASEEALLGDLSHADHNELDLYGDAENFDHLDTAIDDKHIIESNGDGLLNDKLLVMDHNVSIKGEDDNDDDLYNAVITERSSPNGNSTSGGASLATTQLHITGSGTQQRKYSCYVGNLTWWTTDQDLVDAVMAAGITDILDVKFYENRQNGQSKGFALVSFNSEQSVQACMVKLVGKQVHGQQLVVLPYTKHSLAQFEAATRKPNERTQSGGSVSPNAAEMLKAAGVPKPGRPGGPTFIGTFRIGMVQPPPASSQQHMPPTIAIHQGPPPTGHHQILRTPLGAPPPPGAILIRSAPPGTAPPTIVSSPFPPPHHRPGMPPPGGQMILPPPLHQRPPPHHVRLSGPPPGVLAHGMPPPGSHVNPNFYPNIAAAASGGGGPPSQGPPPSSANDAPLSEAEFEEIMNRNRTVSSSAISRAVSDASAGDFASAIETLVTAISLIRQSKVSHDDRCKILISSLQDTLRGIEAKSFGGGSGGSGGSRMSSKDRDRRSRSRDRSKRRRERSRSRSRSRDRFEEYSPRRRRY